ncbi:chemotaxis protein CheW [Dethiobacter alkaliphilus]|uniref:chemotaxis protein CheW n=1 Tax=Dethiobacter alkaliphilus TaxID=427926 RepID=UPI00222718BD|nr:chemotaxis protein CheW [Dethiobacter alkaliphilus]MCW3489110.1 chemotaxis protein CheW [Dethiobacter alkaliphilus]
MSLAMREHNGESSESLFVIFTLAGEEYAAPVSQVREVIKPLPLVKLPQSEECVEGVLNIRGRVMPVLNLKKKLQLSDSEDAGNVRLMIVEAGNICAALRVDHVSEVKSIRLSEAQHVPQSNGSSYLQGVVHCGERLITLLSLEKMFAENGIALILND